MAPLLEGPHFWYFLVKLKFAKKSVDFWLTMQYIKKILSKYDVKVSKIPIGIPMGTDIEYIDTMTLEMAFEDRKDVA